MEFKRCYSCMGALERGDELCPHCGYDNAAGPKAQPDYALPCGTVLNRRYVVGQCLGHGDFGISYIACDLRLDAAVCIKEYFPSGAVRRSRAQGPQVQWGESRQARELNERMGERINGARAAAELKELEHTVKIWNAFYENGTFYMVVDYVEGVTLRQRVQQSGKTWTERECMALLDPVMQDLEKLHARRMIKGDFSPDNLMLQPDGTVIMTDINGFSGFRAPYSAAKQGCSPIEQYVRDGVCGPWTDVYAVCATLCFCLTGVMPPTARERVNGAKPALQMIDKAFAGVLEKGLALQPGDRIQSMGELRGELQAALQPKGKGKKTAAATAAAAAAMVLIGAGLFLWRDRFFSGENPVVLTAPVQSAAAIAETGSPGALIDVETPSYEEELEAYKEAAEKGENSAKVEAGDAYLEHGDYDEALRWYLAAMEQTASDQDDPDTCFKIGYIYERIMGDPDKAEEWYTRARDNGSEIAGQWLDNLNRNTASSGAAASPTPTAAATPSAQQRLLDALARLVGEYGMPEGMRKGQVNPFYPDHLIRQCRKIILELTVTRLSGHPYGRFYIFAKDLNGNWEHIALFEMEERQKNGETVTYTLELEKPESFVALALFPEENGMDFVARFDCVYYVDPDCLEEYSDSIRRPDYTPAGGETPVSGVHAQTEVWSDPRKGAPGEIYNGEYDGKEEYPGVYIKG